MMVFGSGALAGLLSSLLAYTSRTVMGESSPYMPHVPNPTIPVFVVSVVAAPLEVSQGVGCGGSME